MPPPVITAPTHPARRVRTLRLRAPTAEQARHVAVALADALHTATLPGADQGRLVLIRRLALERVDPRASSATLALEVERAARLAVAAAEPADSPAAAQADAVIFGDRAEAVVLVARRVARRQRTDEWYWPAALPGWHAAQSRSDTWAWLLTLAHSQPASAVTACAVVREALSAGAADELASSLPPQAGAIWLRAAGWEPIPTRDPLPSRELVAIPHAQFLRAWVTRWGPQDDRSLWLATILVVLARPARADDACLPQRVRPWLDAVASFGVAHERVSRAAGPPPPLPSRASRGDDLLSAPHQPLEKKTDASTVGDWAVPTRIAASSVATGEPVQHVEREMPPRPEAPTIAESPAMAASDPTLAGAPVDTVVPLAGASTGFAGLLFLVPALARLDMAGFLHANPPFTDSAFAARLLVFVGQRLGLRRDDPMALAIEPVDDCEPDPDEFLLPARLSGILATPAPRTPARTALEVWLVGLRRWCRRVARLGLHSLIRRPGRVLSSRTHLEVCFNLAHGDLRVRRAGLDIDPGWVPWLGRVVLFHYEEQFT